MVRQRYTRLTLGAVPGAAWRRAWR